MNLTLSFKINTFKSTEEAFNFIRRNFHFIPVSINSPFSFSGGYNNFDYDQAEARFKKNNDTTFTISDDFYLYEDEKNKIIYRQDGYKYVQYFIFKFDVLNDKWLSNLLREAHSRGFFMAYVTDTNKSIWQSEKFLNHYIQAGKPYNHLNLRMCWDPELSPIVGTEIIDIFYNPGHCIMTYNTWLMAAPEMWFSKDAWQYLNKRKLQSFTEAIEIKELEEDLLYIRLFDIKTPDYEKRQILDLQAKFRELAGLNEVEKELETKCIEANAQGRKDFLIEQIKFYPTIKTNGNISDN